MRRPSRELLEDLAAISTSFALPLIDLLAAWPSKAPDWSGWLEQSRRSCGARALGVPTGFSPFWQRLAPLLVGPVFAERGGRCPGAAAAGTGGAAASAALRQRPRRADRGGPRGLSFDTVFVPGLAERTFPRKIVEEPILLDTLRERIGAGLTTNPGRLEDERLALALAAGAWPCQICAYHASTCSRGHRA